MTYKDLLVEYIKSLKNMIEIVEKLHYQDEVIRLTKIMKDTNKEINVLVKVQKS